MAENQLAVLGNRAPGSGPRTPLGQGIAAGQFTPADFGSPAGLANSTQVATVAGAAVGQTLTANPTAALPNGIVLAWARVSAANQVTVSVVNVTAAPIAVGFRTFDFNLTA